MEEKTEVEDSKTHITKPRPYQNIYPQKLPKVQHKDEPEDFTGLNLKEKKALEMVWRQIKPKLGYLSWHTYLRIFTENESWLEKFRKEDKLMVAETGRHNKNSGATFGAILENIYDAHKLEVILRNLVKVHYDAGVTREYFEAYLNYVAETILRIFEKVTSPTLIQSLQKLNEFILHGFEVKRYKLSLLYQ